MSEDMVQTLLSTSSRKKMLDNRTSEKGWFKSYVKRKRAKVYYRQKISMYFRNLSHRNPGILDDDLPFIVRI